MQAIQLTFLASFVVTVLLFHTMRWSPDYPDYPTSDRLVLSEGHAVPIIYAAAATPSPMLPIKPRPSAAPWRSSLTAPSERP